jgi:hypothetical protein
MFCPGCGFQVNDDLKYCRQCGANMHSVRDALSSRSGGEKFDLSKKWWAGMFYSPEDVERLSGIMPTPEEKRLREEKKRFNEIKGGVITGMVGVSVMIVFYFFFGAVAKAADPQAAEIVSKLWMLGIIPTLIGAGLLINGFFISRRLAELSEQAARAALSAARAPIAQSGAPPDARPKAIPNAIPNAIEDVLEAQTTNQLMVDAAPAAGYSVTEDSTAHLLDSVPAPMRRETN